MVVEATTITKKFEVTNLEFMAFSPEAYLIQMDRADSLDWEFDFRGMENDLEAVAAETLMEAELRRVEFETRVDQEGRLVWLAPGFGREGGDVIKMSDLTVKRYLQMSEDLDLSREERAKARVMAERFWLERQQTEKIIEELSSDQEGEMVMAILPDNEVVYPATQVNYVTVYRLETDEEGTKIAAYPLMNRYSKRLLSQLSGKENSTEAELLLGVQKIKGNLPERVLWEIDSLVTEEERQKGLVGTIIDRTLEIEACRPVIKAGREFLEGIIRLEYSRLKSGESWVEIKNRLGVAMELVIKNIVGFLSHEKYLDKTGLLGKIEWYAAETLMGFSRSRFLRAIVKGDDLQILNQPLVKVGACGSLGFGGLGEIPFGASLAEWKLGTCANPGCRHKGEVVMVGACSICADCEKVL